VISRREALKRLGAGALGVAVGGGALLRNPEERRLATLLEAARRAGPGAADRATAVGLAARGTPYRAHALDDYLKAGGSPETEPLTVSLADFDCVTFVEACLAIGEMASAGAPADWGRFGREVERLRYRNGQRFGYPSRLHYFSEWIADNVRRGRLRDIGQELGARPPGGSLHRTAPSTHRSPAAPSPRATTGPAATPLHDLQPRPLPRPHEGVFRAIQAQERALDPATRWVVPTDRIPEVQDRIESGDVVAFATSIEGLDVTHASFAHRTADGVLRILHAPLSGGAVEVTSRTLHQYVRGLGRGTGILVARPL
jgi:hypothetical protein